MHKNRAHTSTVAHRALETATLGTLQKIKPTVSFSGGNEYESS